MTTEDILKKLEDDNHYYGDFGRQYLSYSSIGTLLKNPKDFGKPTEKTVPMLLGGYFHTIILEPEKVDAFKIVDASSRNTNKYKEISGDQICMLEKEADMIKKWRDVMMANDQIRSMVQDGNVEYEKPAIMELEGEWWKGKADVVNHDQKLIVDLKTTGNIDQFRWSAKKFNYDAQAFIYQSLFPGYSFVFAVIDKNTEQLGIYDCSENFLSDGYDKVREAVHVYRDVIKNPDFEMEQFAHIETL